MDDLFSKRMRRTHFGFAVIIVTVFQLLIYMFAKSADSPALAIFTLLVAAILNVIFSVRRLHDMNKSGWVALLGFVPLVNWIFFVYLVFQDGTIGPNAFGADPKNR